MLAPEDYPLWNSPAMSAYLKTLSPENMLVEGRGVRVRDASGRWFLDARSGLWNVTLGYDHPRVIEAIRQQLGKLPYANLIGYGRPSAISMEAANALLPHLPAGLSKIRYCGNGAQAVEIAVLLSRFLHRMNGLPERTAVFGLWRGFHGLGATAGALTGIPYIHFQSGALLPDIAHGPGPFEPMGAPGSDLERLMADYGPERIAAVVVEPVVGEGAHVLGADYLRSLEKFCRASGIHLIVDEITTGMGRTGGFTYIEQVGICPDILTLGKGLSAGYAPLSAVVLADGIFQQLLDMPYDRPFFIGATNDGHPLGLAASIAVIESLVVDGVLDDARTRGKKLAERLHEVGGRHQVVSAVRGTGLMYGIELGEPGGTAVEDSPANHLRLAMDQRGVLVSTLAKWPAIAIVPPLIVSDEDIEEIAGVLDEALTEIPVGRSSGRR